MKMKIGGRPVEEDVERVYAVREAIDPDVRLAVDANEAYNARTAISVGRRLGDASLAWLEEPCVSYGDTANRRVRDGVPMPVSGGESLQSRYEFAERLAKRTFDIIQPDVVNVGGVSELVAVGQMANASSIQINPHFWGTGISFAASLYACSVLPVTPPSLAAGPYEGESVLEFYQTAHLVRENIRGPRFELREGGVLLPTVPGLEIEEDEKAITRFTVGPPTVNDGHA